MTLNKFFFIAANKLFAFNLFHVLFKCRKVALKLEVEVIEVDKRVGAYFLVKLVDEAGIHELLIIVEGGCYLLIESFLIGPF